MPTVGSCCGYDAAMRRVLRIIILVVLIMLPVVSIGARWRCIDLQVSHASVATYPADLLVSWSPSSKFSLYITTQADPGTPYWHLPSIRQLWGFQFLFLPWWLVFMSGIPVLGASWWALRPVKRTRGAFPVEEVPR